MEFDEIVVKETPGLCRCCLSEGCYKDLSTEYTWMEEQEIYADMLLECFDISISQHMEGPNGPNRLICEVCITRLRDACNFKKQVLESEKKFVDMVGRGEFKARAIAYTEPMKSEMMLDLQTVEETEVEYLDDDMDYDDGSKEDPEPTVSEDVTVTALAVKGKRGRPKKTLVKPEKKKPKSEEKPKTKIAKDEGPYEHCTSVRRRKNLQTLFNNTTILPFKWRGKYQCFYCGLTYSEYPEFRKHTKSHGLCSTSDNSLKLIKGNHIELKIDISEIECEVCYEPFPNFNEIIDHLTGKHGLEYDKTVDTPFQEYRLADNRCHLCEQQFTYFGNLITHTNIAHPKNNLICDNCGLKFNKKRDLAFHLRNYHRDGGYRCEECSEVFPTSLLLTGHKNNFHFRRCKLCDARFPSYTLLQKHKERDHPDDGSQSLCHYCSKQCKSTASLKQHLRNCKTKNFKVTIPAFPEETVQPKKKRDIMQIRKNIQCILNMSTAIPFRFFSRFSCFHCSKNFVEFDDLKSHVVTEHPVCDLKDKSMKKCKGERITVKIDISALSCKLCYERLDNLDDLIDHLITKHNASYDKSITECFDAFKIIKDNIPCNICSNVFRYFSSLLRHINSEHSNNNKICDYCGRSFKNVANLNVHITYAHTGACECEVCGVKYKNQWCLGRHKAKSHNAKDFQCSKCDERFQSQYHKQKHMIKAHEIGHKCTYCGKMFTRNSFMKDHIRRTHLKEKNVPCSVCNEKFFDNYLLRLHMVKHKGERNFSCEVCGKAFLRRSAKLCTMEDKCKKTEMVRKLLAKRRNVEYVLEYSNATPFMWYKGKYRCFYCAEPMKDPVTLREHTAVMHQTSNLELVVFDRTKNNRNRDAAVKIDVTDICCKLCPQAVNSLEQLINHLIIAHDAEYDVSVPNCLLPFKLNKDQPSCPICNIDFVFFEYLLRHANKHHLAHDYICDVCGTSFQGENHLKMHNRYYHREGGYTCEHCGISLATLSKKTLHEKNVHLMNLSTCPHCPETFKSPYFKKLHLANVHGVEELKIKCPYCPKVYPQESIMSRHMRRVHLREKNVECQVCGDKFFGPYDVKLHMLKHNGDKKFVCSVCGKKFSKKSNLNSHTLTHTGQKKYICTICGKEFAHRPNLRIHFRSCHPQYVTEQGISVLDDIDDGELVEITRLELDRELEPVEETV
ncbi:zinc finger protein 728-like isoform X2 [Maniola hyperantus]|uniref:zinc finger protein 728-like isoform X2 n=1 Tax=Aphantopus hyperantus TaxID=2795564 RepID=UPI001567F3F7|nr:zinc finger protein 91-like [Maniola hyperantus]